MFGRVPFVVSLLAVAVSVACRDSTAGALPSAPSSIAQSGAFAVPAGIWRLQSFQRSDAAVPVPDPDRFTIEVRADGQLSVQADCNRCAASYSQSGGTLKVNPAMACTRAFCSTAPFDGQYTAALSGATLVRASDTSLEFVSASGRLTFAR